MTYLAIAAPVWCVIVTHQVLISVLPRDQA
jgi:hypothetical protein